MQLIDRITITLRNRDNNAELPVDIDIMDSPLSRRWLAALNELLEGGYHLEKNYSWLGFAEGPRSGEFLIKEINRSIQAVNDFFSDYQIDLVFDLENSGSLEDGINHHRFNLLHRAFEDLQGVAGRMSPYYERADDLTRWHIRQLNLLCHEFESWFLSWRKSLTQPEWQRPSQLMCWLQAPRFELQPEDFELFGIETMNRPLGGVYVGVNKAIGKSHWEVFWDEGKDGADIDALTTTAMRGQTLAAGDFDIEWANNPGNFSWQQQRLQEFRSWLIRNGFDPEDKTLTIGHPQVGQVDLTSSFGTEDYRSIWSQLASHLDVVRIKTSAAEAEYKYCWSDPDYISQQIAALKGH